MIEAIIGTIVVTVLGGLGWLVLDWMKIRSESKAKDIEIEAQSARADRILKEKEAENEIRKNRPVSDIDLSRRL